MYQSGLAKSRQMLWIAVARDDLSITRALCCGLLFSRTARCLAMPFVAVLLACEFVPAACQIELPGVV